MEVNHKQLVEALRDALTYPGDDRPALVARIPVICNDIRWIKRGVFGLYAVIGMLVATAIARSILGI